MQIPLRFGTGVAGFLAALFVVTVQAEPQPLKHRAHEMPAAAASVKSEMVTTEKPVAGKKATAIVRLTGSDGKPLALDQLQVAHTEKLHLLVVDETRTDYHHEHPVAAERPGEYTFEFSPRFGGTYYIWADVVPTATGQQEYAKTEVKVQGPPAAKDRTLNTTAEADGYRFSLTTENNETLQTGKATMVKVKVTTLDGRDFTALEPVMGAYAHMVAFPENLDGVTHIHPMGPEPEAATERGGPELSFHVEPEKPGFQKFFLQTQIGGREVYAAFGMEVKTGKATTAAGTEFVCPMHPEVTQNAPGKCPKCGMSLTAQEPGSVTPQAHGHGH